MIKKDIIKFLFFVGIIGLIMFVNLSINNKKINFNNNNFSKTEIIKINKQTIFVKTVDTVTTRMQGLSGKEKLNDNEGMFFVFDEISQHGIWMRDMNFPIDIVWISIDLQIVAIEENVSPDTYPKIFSPEVSSRYVLELPAGKINKINLSVGDKIEI